MISAFDYIPKEFKLLAIICSILIITIIVNWAVKRAFFRASNMKKVDQTTLGFAQRLVSIIIYTLGISAALTHIPEFKIIGHSLLAGAGIMTLIAGLASQQILGNIVSGFMIIFFRPFRIGDKITVSSTYTGIVEDINLRETVVRDFENNRVIIPNSQISTQIIINANHTDNLVCKFIDVGIGYSSDVDNAMAIMIEEINKHPFNVDIRTAEQIESGTPAVTVRLITLGNSSVNLRAWAWAANPGDGYALLCDSLVNIKRRFDAAGIEIPFPQTTISFSEGASLSTITKQGNKTNAPQ